MERIDEIYFMVGEVNGKMDTLLDQSKDHNKRIKSLETSRTKFLTISGLVGAGVGWLVSLLRGG